METKEYNYPKVNVKESINKDFNLESIPLCFVIESDSDNKNYGKIVIGTEEEILSKLNEILHWRYYYDLTLLNHVTVYRYGKPVSLRIDVIKIEDHIIK